MLLKNIKYVLFDAANTIIHKPVLWTKILSVFEKYGIDVPADRLKYHHKLLSEIIDFPDRTSRDFYSGFNKEFLLSLGIIPSEKLLEDLFTACTYLPWERFDDTEILSRLTLPLGVLSNFNNNLPQLLDSLFGNIFSNIIVSESLNIRKPDPAFYQHAIKEIGLRPEEVLYIGDSLKLDIIPAKQLGMHTFLIDRLSVFNASDNAIPSLNKLSDLIINN